MELLLLFHDYFPIQKSIAFVFNLLTKPLKYAVSKKGHTQDVVKMSTLPFQGFSEAIVLSNLGGNWLLSGESWGLRDTVPQATPHDTGENSR